MKDGTCSVVLPIFKDKVVHEIFRTQTVELALATRDFVSKWVEEHPGTTANAIGAAMYAAMLSLSEHVSSSKGAAMKQTHRDTMLMNDEFLKLVTSTTAQSPN